MITFFRQSFTQRFPLLIASCLVSLAVFAPKSWSKSKERIIQIFDIAKEPSKADWQTFHKLERSGREQLWNYHQARGKQLKHWSWGWRIGWARSCSDANGSYCAGVLKDGLKDRALVVRAETATVLGDRYEGSKNARVISSLSRAYRDKRNYRNGKPLFIQRRILFALKKIGGPTAYKAGQRLAAASPASQQYWRKLTKKM